MPSHAYQRKDFYYKKAKQQGLKSRAAFKIIELDSKYKLLKPSMHVVDLGCSPGGWLQFLCKAVGPGGLVIGVDLEAIPTPLTKNAILIQGDIREDRTKQRILSLLGRKVDLVVSDLAPHLSGIKFQDHYNSYELAEQAFKLCRLVLRQEGNFLVKIFPGEELESFRQNLKNSFRRVDLFVPDSTRKSSSEMYVIARGFAPSPSGV